MKSIKYDYTLMMKNNIGRNGIDHEKLNSQKVKKAYDAIINSLDKEDFDFIRELKDLESEKIILTTASELKKKFKQLLVIGIGGSDLGARALQSVFTGQVNAGGEVLFLGDTTDPVQINKICSQVDWERAAINVVSKSGNTTEVMAVFLHVRKLLINAVGKQNHNKHVFITTDSRESMFNDLITLHDYAWIQHPQNVGGRWTIFSNVALISAAFSGVNVSRILKGARDYYKTFTSTFENSATIFATLHFYLYKKGFTQNVMMPYCSGLEEVGNWYRQLWAESLGKSNLFGPTPVASVGPKDQHSQLQLYNNGPLDKVVTFIKVNKHAGDITIPKHWMNETSIEYLNGKSMTEILNIEQLSTAMALAQSKRPNGTLVLPEICEYHIGQLFMMLMLSCVVEAKLAGVNAFNQPGVEQVKKNMHAFLNKSGYEQQKQTINKQMDTYEQNVA